MKLASLLNALAVIMGIIGVAFGMMSWFMSEASFLGPLGNNLDDKAQLLLFTAIWLALWTQISLQKENAEE